MSAPQFTPRPWLIHAKHRWIVPAEDAFKEAADALPICQLRDPDERLTEDQTLANGFLIAAAPELYEALRAVDVARMTDAPADWKRATKLSDAALAKVRGHCPGHVASDADPKVCRHCGTHVDEYRDEPVECEQ